MARLNPIWLPTAFALLMTALSSAYPYYTDQEFEEMKRFLQQEKQRGMYAAQEPGEYDYKDALLSRYGDQYRINSVQNPEDEEELEGMMVEAERWPEEYVSLTVGQVGGVAVDKNNDCHVFHRGRRVWDNETFDEKNNYRKKSEGPISQATILVLSQLDGKVNSKWGQKTFYMPHGLTIDHQGNTWLTDVAMHQVFKYKPNAKEPSLVLGKAFEPAASNTDPERFCKPTDVAVASNGDFFVADGYCNSRVMRFSADGKLLAQIGKDGEFDVVHSLALAENMDVLCIADRDNERIVCVNAGLRNPSRFGESYITYTKGPLQPRDPNEVDSIGRVFGIAYSPREGFLYVVTESSYRKNPHAFTIDLRERDMFNSDIIAEWTPSEKNVDFFELHDIDVSVSGDIAYVGSVDVDEKSTHKVFKFVTADEEE